MIKEILLVILAFTTGVALYFIIVEGIPPMTLINSVTNRIPSLPTLIDTVKNNLSLIGTGIGGLTGISYLVKKVSEWKARTIQATEQAETWKNQTITQNIANINLEKENTELKEKLETFETPDLKITELTNDLGEAQKLVTEKQQIINGQTATINDLHRVIEELKLKEKTVTVVK